MTFCHCSRDFGQRKVAERDAQWGHPDRDQRSPITVQTSRPNSQPPPVGAWFLRHPFGRGIRL